jgi:prepilin-type N-terminal cleavage/methylation domain-containing protein
MRIAENKVKSSEFKVRRLKTRNHFELRTNYSELFLNPSGFTVIEIILAMMIIAILAAIAIPRFDFATSSKTSVNGAAYVVVSDIRYAQEFAMANRTTMGLNFNSNSSSYTFSKSSSLNPSGQLPSGVTIGNNFKVTFNSLGEPTTGGGGSVSVSGGGQSKTVTVVNYTGKVNIN